MGRLTLRQLQLLLGRREEAEVRRDMRAARLGIFTSRTDKNGKGLSAEELWPSLRPPPPTPEEFRQRFLNTMIALGADVPDHILHPKKGPSHG